MVRAGTYKRRILSSILALLLPSCSVYHVHEFPRPCTSLPSNFLRGKGGEGSIVKWWTEFNQPELNKLVDYALYQNLDIKQAWDRLAQAKFAACIVNSERYPQINLDVSAEFQHQVKKLDHVNTSFMTYIVNPTLTYEIDLWRKIDSRVHAADLAYCATKEDLEGTALLVAGTVTNLWFLIEEQKALLKLINYQVELSETLLELVELRFSLGQSSALDVYQQRLQLEQTRTTAIPVLAALKNASHQMNVLLGSPPKEQWVYSQKIEDINLPPFPYMGTPADLICRRPDLRAAHYRVKSADYEVAAAIADLYPRLVLSSSYELRTRDLGQLFQEEIFKIAGRLMQPIYDGCRRRCEVARRKAIVKERLDNFGQRFLVALQEIEDAVVNESSQLELLRQIAKQIEIAKLNLEEARLRYANGLNDYLTVISAIQSLQGLERRMINEHRILLTTRSNLYRALGGPCLVDCDNRCYEFYGNTNGGNR